MRQSELAGCAFADFRHAESPGQKASISAARATLETGKMRWELRVGIGVW